jgi:Protein of unknown function (DUF1569)
MDSRLLRLQKEIREAVSSMTPDELARQNGDKWSAGMILEHLYLTYTRSTKGFERCAAEGKPLARRVALKDRLQAMVVVGLGYLPEGRKAPEGTRPKGISTEQVTGDIGFQIERMDAAIAACEAKYGRKTRLVDHPVIGPLTGSQWRKFHWVHGRHHLRQLARVKQSM